MDNPLRQQESDTQQSNAFVASLRIFNDILQWLASLIQLTEEEQEDAGIYFGDPHYK